MLKHTTSLLASERSVRDTYTGKNEKIGDVRLLASETLTGVTQSKIGVFVCWRASVASETVLGVDNAKSGICYMYICMWDGTYAP